MPKPIIVVLTLPGALDPSLAIAANRAGALGILDLEYSPDNASALQAVITLASATKAAYGVKVSCQQNDLLFELLAQSFEYLTVVLLKGNDRALLQQAIACLLEKRVTILFEVIDLDQARLGAELGVHGLIAKGNEAGGQIGEETTFVLLQAILAKLTLPVYAQGGIGLHTAAACLAAGATGVVLDSQLALTRESNLPAATRQAIGDMDGSESICLGGEVGALYRMCARPGYGGVDTLRREETDLIESQLSPEERLPLWNAAVRRQIGWDDLDQKVLLLGQDAAFAAMLARRFVTVSGILSAIYESIEAHFRLATELRPLDRNSPLAQSHGTRYPIVQGPMTRVSDRPAFAREVAQAGGLPFLALALMRQDECVALLQATRQEMGSLPWGVGILGFVPSAIRQEQLQAIQQIRPAFALIAGGRPDQANVLEQQGIPAYLHVPSPALLKLFLGDGACRFVFEGRECGGHIGPRSSFVLWESMIEVLLEYLARHRDKADQIHILFAGGIHDARSSAMVAILAAPLCNLGVRVGVLMGSAYLFTREAVATQAIVATYQEAVLNSGQTITLASGTGHITRCLPTAFARTFAETKRQLEQAGVSGDQLRDQLEALNLGRLRIATKGIVRNPSYHEGTAPLKYIGLNSDQQLEQGMYMVGQVIALRDQVCSIAQLHHTVAIEGSARLESLPALLGDTPKLKATPQPARIAIIGMSCLLPGASDLQSYWENILNKVDAVTEVPADRWDWRRYFDPDRSAKDKIYSHWGGFIGDILFDPLDYGMPPNSVRSIEPLQLLMLEVVRAALVNAGYQERPFPRERTSVIVAAGGGLGDLGYLYGFRSYLPHFLDPQSADVIERLNEQLPEWTEDSFPGILLNVIAGRIANRFDLGGPNFLVDAACASSLAALDVAIKDLESHRTDMAIVGAGDTVQSPFAFLAFSKTHALSPTGRCRPFDTNADGIAISEGLAVVILKRLDDAERDGDQIYAVIDGVGGSSDGKERGLTAPHPAGQMRALSYAYEKAGFNPKTIGLIEAHGTGTRLGDLVEIESLSRFFQSAQFSHQSCAIGSVKSMIGHTKSTAGLAGLVKTALALHHKVLPPTLIEMPNSKIDFAGSQFYVNNEARPWFASAAGQPRRAGVSAFGFGGTNFHVVMEEYRNAYLPSQASRQAWPAELLLFYGADRRRLSAALEQIQLWLQEDNAPPLRDLAYSLYRKYNQARPAATPPPGQTLAIVATSLEDARQKLAQAHDRLVAGDKAINDPRGVYYTERPFGSTANTAFLFPGQGAQYPNMLRDLAIQFPQVRASFERANTLLADKLPGQLTNAIFPIPAFSDADAESARAALTATSIAQPALGAASMAITGLLREMGITPDVVAGHSYGEIVALWQAGVLCDNDLLAISEARGRFMAEAGGPESGTMAAVRASPERVAEAICSIPAVVLANLNSPAQTVISGPKAAIEQALEQLQAQTISGQLLPVACAFHSPLVEPAREQFADLLGTITFSPPQREVYSNTTAELYPHEPEAIRALLSEHLVCPVEFQREIEALYAAGTRIFVEAGPNSVLSGLVGQILEGRPHVAIPIDRPNSPGLVTLQKALGQLAAAGLLLRLDPLYERRSMTIVDFSRPYKPHDRAHPSPTAVRVNAGRVSSYKASPAESRLAVSPLKVRLDTMPSEASIMHSEQHLPSQSAQGSPARSTQAATIEPAPVMSAATATSRSSGGNLPSDDLTQVLLQHQQLMSSFLQAQQQIMLSYLGAAPGVPIAQQLAPSDTAPTLPSVDITDLPPPANSSNAQAAAPQQPTVEAQEYQAQGDLHTNGHTSQITTESLTRQLVSLASDRTGYPVEMLDIDADLEAGLGIDSIKRVEILGAFRHSDATLEALLAGPLLEELQGKHTLRAMVAALVAHIERRGGAQAMPLSSQSDQAEPATSKVAASDHLSQIDRTTQAIPPLGLAAAPILRYILDSAEAALPDMAAPLSRDYVILITDDGRAIGQSVANTLRERGYQVVLVTNIPHASLAADMLVSDLASPASVQALLATIHQTHGRIGVLLHLMSLRHQEWDADVSLETWRNELRCDLNSLFYLLQGVQEDLLAAALADGACVLAATSMGGQFASSGAATTASFFPGQGGIAGLLKTAAHELRSVRFKVVDLDTLRGTSAMAAAIVQEITAGDGLVEVGYTGSTRTKLRVTPAPLERDRRAQPSISTGSTILITGGARGITAEVARELAARYRPTLLLVGRSAPPPAEESPVTAKLTSERAIKEVLIKSLSGNGHQVTLAEVEAAYQRLRREREMRANLAAMRSAGATVHYYQANVCDERAFGALIDELYRTYGQLDGVIHGAGLIEDKLIKDKTPESFERVISTKADSAFILSQKLRPENLAFLVFFSSVSGRFGNKGQGDYAAANEVLNKLAIYLDQRWPGRCLSVNWGPWDASGMVSEPLRHEFAQRGVSLIPAATGVQQLLDELAFGRKGDVEIMICGEDTQLMARQ